MSIVCEKLRIRRFDLSSGKILSVDNADNIIKKNKIESQILKLKDFIFVMYNYSPIFIGVHCTHGFNRTGFLIISYLVEQFSWE